MELRHLRYFVAVVRWNGYREAARHLHVGQSAISQTILDLEGELELKLFSRERHTLQLTPEGSVFHEETLRTLEQSAHAVDSAKRAARGEIGRLSIGFLGSATYAFLPRIIRKYKALYPGVKLLLQELTPLQQEKAFQKGEIDVGFTRRLSEEQGNTLTSRLLYRDPLLAVLPAGRTLTSKEIPVIDLANDRFILFHRVGAPGLFDTITGLCNQHGFSPTVDSEPSMMQTVLSLVEAEQGVSIVPACVRNLRAEGVQFARLQPDQVKIELVVAWPKDSTSAVIRSFIDMLIANEASIRKEAEI